MATTAAPAVEPAAPARRRRRRRRTRSRAARRRQWLMYVAEHSVRIALVLAFLAPLVFIALTSLMTNDQALSPKLWPTPFKFSNYTDVFHKAPLLRYTLNTFIYAALSTIGVVLSSVPV